MTLEQPGHAKIKVTESLAKAAVDAGERSLPRTRTGSVWGNANPFLHLAWFVLTADPQVGMRLTLRGVFMRA